ncbi:hypothetical protein Tco_0304639 [Tanacetum coccineum]
MSIVLPRQYLLRENTDSGRSKQRDELLITFLLVFAMGTAGASRAGADTFINQLPIGPEILGYNGKFLEFRTSRDRYKDNGVSDPIEGLVFLSTKDFGLHILCLYSIPSSGGFLKRVKDTNSKSGGSPCGFGFLGSCLEAILGWFTSSGLRSYDVTMEILAIWWDLTGALVSLGGEISSEGKKS